MAVTRERKNKSVDAVAELPADVSPEQVNAVATTPPAVDVPPVLPTGVVDQPAQEPVAPPSEPIVVKTPGGIAGDLFFTQAQEAFRVWYATRPITATFVAPSADEIKARVKALIVEREIDPTEDYDAVAQARQDVLDGIAADKAKMSDQHAIDRDFLSGAIKALDGLRADLGKLMEEAGGKLIVTTARSKASTGERATSSKVTATWKELNPKLIAWAQERGLKDFVLRDSTANGYQNSFHAIRALSDGKWEKVTYDPATHAYAPTGEIVEKPIYFSDSEGNRPQWDVWHMFKVLMAGVPAMDGITIVVKKENTVYGDFRAIVDSVK